MNIEDEIKIRKPREIVLDQIQFKKRISVGQNIFEYPIAYHTRKLIIQTPIVYIPYSTYKIDNKITFDFYFLNLDVDRDMEDLKFFVEGVDKKAIQKINLDKSKQSKNREFISNIKKSRSSCMNEKPDKMRVSLYDNILSFNEMGKPISLDFLRYKTYLKLLMCPTKIWVNGNKYGIFWEVLQVKIYPKTILNKYMFIDDSQSSIISESSTDFVSKSSLESFKQIPHPKFSKYFDMLKKGVPKGAVRNKMLMDNVDPNILDNKSYSYKSVSSSSLLTGVPPPPPPPPQLMNFNQTNSINIVLSDKPNVSSENSISGMNAIFNQIKQGNTLLRKVTDSDKNINKKHFSKKKPKLTAESSFTPSLDDILNARSSLKKKSNKS
jgi:hypothetical protein